MKKCDAIRKLANNLEFSNAGPLFFDVPYFGVMYNVLMAGLSSFQLYLNSRADALEERANYYAQMGTVGELQYLVTKIYIGGIVSCEYKLYN